MPGPCVCYVAPQVSGRLRARPPARRWRCMLLLVAPLVFRAPPGPAARSPLALHVVACGTAGVPGASGPGRPRDRHTRAYGSEWSISKPARALRTLRRPPIGRYLVCLYLAWPCRHPRAPRPGLLTTLPQQTVRKTQSPPVVTVVVSWFPNNVACNSPATLSNFEFTSLKFQRFQTLLKRQPIELHARFRGALPHGAKRGACRVRPGSLSRRARRTRRARPCLSPGARRAPGAWREPRRAASRHSGTPTPPTQRPSRSSGTSARPRGK